MEEENLQVMPPDENPLTYVQEVNQALPAVDRRRSQGVLDWLVAVHPPDTAHDLPMHQTHRRYMEQVKQGAHMARLGHEQFSRGPGARSQPCTCVQELGIAVCAEQAGKLRKVRCEGFASQGECYIVDGETLFARGLH